MVRGVCGLVAREVFGAGGMPRQGGPAFCGTGLGMFVDNCRRRADKLIPERQAALTELGMRW